MVPGARGADTGGRAALTRVLHITRDFPPRQAGGVSIAVGALARAQARAGAPPAVISLDGYRPRARPGGADAPRGESQGRISVFRASAPAHLEGALAFARSAQPAVIHIHDPLAFGLADTLRAELGAPIALTRHVAHAVQDRLRGLAEPTASARAEAEALAGADAIHAPSRAAAADLAPDAAERTIVAPLAADLGAETASSPAPRRRGGPVAYVGRFSDLRGTGDLLRAIPAILERHPEARFVLAGGCPESRRADRRWRRRVDRELDTAARARVEVPGWLERRELAALYDRARALVLPSRFETFGLAAVEAMARGAPIAAARAGGLAEILADRETALLFEPGNERALADRVGRLLGDAESASSLGARAAEIARARYTSWARAAREIAAVYDRAARR